jgi:hypothetical protein
MTESPTTVVSTRPVTDRAEFRYHLLRAAGERFQTGIGGLELPGARP